MDAEEDVARPQVNEVPRLSCGRRFLLIADKLIIEALGAFFYMLMYPLATYRNSELSPVAIGFMLSAMVFCFDFVSGGHFNPVVSLAVVLVNGRRSLESVAFPLMHVLGAFSAAVFASILTPRYPIPNPGLDILSMVRAFFAEFIFTTVLCLVYLNLDAQGQTAKPLKGFAVGMVVTASIMASGGILRVVMNPAVTLSLMGTKCMFTGECEALASLLIYLGADFAASLTAGFFFLFTSHFLQRGGSR